MIWKDIKNWKPIILHVVSNDYLRVVLRRKTLELLRLEPQANGGRALGK